MPATRLPLPSQPASQKQGGLENEANAAAAPASLTTSNASAARALQPAPADSSPQSAPARDTHAKYHEPAALEGGAVAPPASGPDDAGVDGSSSGKAPAALAADPPVMPSEEHLAGGLLPSGLATVVSQKAAVCHPHHVGVSRPAHGRSSNICLFPLVILSKLGGFCE